VTLSIKKSKGWDQRELDFGSKVERGDTTGGKVSFKAGLGSLKKETRKKNNTHVLEGNSFPDKLSVKG